jgi:hypothetical protein
VHVLSGPPKNRKSDARVVREFMQRDGTKVICGSTTMELAARVLGKTVRVEGMLDDRLAPPEYSLDGVELVTEGAITLNQAYNILDEDVRSGEGLEGPVLRLCALLRSADCVHFWLGRTENANHDRFAFKQAGILSRGKIIALIAERLRRMGKLVVVESV